MQRLLQPFLLLLASATDKELAKVVQFLKAENEQLRSRIPGRITLTTAERARLVKLGKTIGAGIKDVITIVSPRTFSRWLAAEGTDKKPKRKKPAAKPGRPKTPDDVRALVVRLAKENEWGYTRIEGELKKLGVRKMISRTSIVNILKENGFDPGPKRGTGTWEDFIRIHAKTLWACDFFSKKVWTTKGLVEYFVLFFIQVGSRRVHIAGMTPNPNARWVGQQARNVAMHFAELTDKPTYILRDYDAKFGKEFDAVFKAEDIVVKKVGPVAPNMNAIAERWVQTLRQECLDHFIAFGEDHLRHILREYETHYNEERPHQALGNEPLKKGEAQTAGEIVCSERLGGLLKHYHRKAA